MLPLFRCLRRAAAAGLPALLALGAQAAEPPPPSATADADALSAQACSHPPADGGPAVLLRLDNDLLGGRDEGYTNGAVFTLVSGNLASYTDDACLPGFVRQVNRGLRWLQPRQAEQRNLVLDVGQAILTPGDNDRSDPILDDRPYAAVLAAALSYQGRSGPLLETTTLLLGWVGPSARGEEVQRLVHKVTGSRRFNGWRNQLRDEPVLQLQREWASRGPASEDAGSDRTGWDTVGRLGAGLGTLNTGAVAGAQWRWGTRLPDDFGSVPTWAGALGTAPARRAAAVRAGWSGHVFVGTDLRLVAHDLTLDGNVLHRSQSVERRTFVGELSYGLVLQNGPWRVALARYHRGHEFEGQRQRPVFGSIVVSRAL